jgi:hypothetical protein
LTNFGLLHVLPTNPSWNPSVIMSGACKTNSVFHFSTSLSLFCLCRLKHVFFIVLGIPMCFSGCSTISGVQKNLKYYRMLLGSSKSTFMPCLPVNGKCGHSAPGFANLPCCMVLLSLTFFFSLTEVTLCSPHDDIYTLISLSLCIFALRDITMSVLWKSLYNTCASHTHLLARTCHNVYWQKLKSSTASHIKQSAHSCHTLK